jgi:preprotein translocase subunit SecF
LARERLSFLEREGRVGYRRPPVHTRFRKGQSGNPSGRRKGAGIRTAAEKVMGRKVMATVDGERRRVPISEAVLLQVTQKALTALAVYLALLSIFLVLYFDWRMAIAALVALVHDVVLTIGIYSVLRFEVTPATIIGVLTILGFSLYDTVVVFDKVKENTRGILGQSRQTYSQAANLAVNQTLVRSINTSIVALLPVASILFVGAGLLGAGTLKDLALALFVGTAAGTYSSIFIATPLLAQLEEHNPQMQALAGRVQARGAGPRGAAASTPATGAAASAAGAEAELSDDADGSQEAMDRARARRATGPRNQPKKQSRADRH